MDSNQKLFYWVVVCIVIAIIATIVNFIQNQKKHKQINKKIQISDEEIQFVDKVVSQMEPAIDKLEQERKSKIPLIILTIILCNTPILIYIIFPIWKRDLFNLFTWYFCLEFAAIIITMVIAYQYLLKDYYKEFKANIITEIIKLLGGQNLEYNYTKYINENDFGASNLFNFFNIYIGDDLIAGEINSLRFQCSELHVKYHTKSGKTSKTIPIFDGLFFIIDIPQNIDKDKRFGTNSNFGSEILLDNIEFNQLFKVFGNDNTEAFYILSSKVLEKMVNYVHKTGQNFQFSFKGNKLYIAIEAGNMKQFFEPPIFKSLWDYKIYDEIVMDFKLIFELLNQLEFRRSLT